MSACSIGTDAPEKPGTARVRIEGNTPHPLMLITGREVYEQIDPLNGTVTPRVEDPDTLQITLPYDATLNIARTGCVYVELRNLLVPTASVRMRVDLDNGENYDRTATLSDDAALIYYYLTGPSAYW
jgi:hypothetical protein